MTKQVLSLMKIQAHFLQEVMFESLKDRKDIDMISREKCWLWYDKMHGKAVLIWQDKIWESAIL